MHHRITIYLPFLKHTLTSSLGKLAIFLAQFENETFTIFSVLKESLNERYLILILQWKLIDNLNDSS